jgi:hypothetical protein
MNHSSHQTHLSAIDQAILALFQERVRLCQSAPATVAIDHMLRRVGNDVNAEDVRALFTLLEQSCTNNSTSKPPHSGNGPGKRPHSGKRSSANSNGGIQR